MNVILGTGALLDGENIVVRQIERADLSENRLSLTRQRHQLVFRGTWIPLHPLYQAVQQQPICK